MYLMCNPDPLFKPTVGGYSTGPKKVIDLLRNKSRPYLFSNSLPPPVVASSSKVSLCCYVGYDVYI